MNLSRSVFSFGSPCNGQYGHLVLRDGGEIYGYSHPNEHSWSYDNETLHLHGIDGSVTSRFKHCNISGGWFGHVEDRKWPLYLVPILQLEAPVGDINASRPSFFVNSIPKSGTYYVEAALQAIGIASQRLHLSGRDTVDDYRELPESLIHVAPEKVRLSCEAELITAMLQGEQTVGHIEHQWVIDKIRAQRVCVLSVVRNLRNVIASLFRFKQSKVAPTSAIDQYWRELTGSEQIIGFLFHHAERDLAHIRAIADMMQRDSDAILLRYEDMCVGSISPAATERLNAVEPGIAERLCSSLAQQYGHANPTYSGSTSDWTNIWNPDLERYFVTSGLSDLNHSLGYE